MRDYGNRIKCSTGQALVEMAIIIFLLLLLVIGIFEFGRAMYVKNTLTHAARAGARTAIVTPSLLPQSNLNCTTSTNVVATSACAGLITSIDKSQIAIDIALFDPAGNSKATAATAGDSVRVTVTWNNFNWLFVPRFTAATPGGGGQGLALPSTLKGATAMRYE